MMSERTSFRSGAWFVALVGVIAAFGGACAAGDEPRQLEQQRYELSGEVVAIDPEHSTLTVAHGEVEGFMAAMTMPFNIRDEWVLEAAKPGSSIRLVNQDGLEATMASYRGRPLVFTFIYTRCPLPDFCPRMSEHFDDIYDAVVADPARFGDPHLLSISVDPAYDTPAVLKQYGARYLEEDAPQGFERWEFATAEPAALKTIAEFVGLRFMPDRGEIIHSLRTVIADPDGRVVEVFVGKGWKPEELLATLESAAVGDS